MHAKWGAHLYKQNIMDVCKTQSKERRKKSLTAWCTFSFKLNRVVSSKPEGNLMQISSYSPEELTWCISKALQISIFILENINLHQMVIYKLNCADSSLALWFCRSDCDCRFRRNDTRRISDYLVLRIRIGLGPKDTKHRTKSSTIRKPCNIENLYIMHLY